MAVIDFKRCSHYCVCVAVQEPALLTEMELRVKWEQALGPHYDVMVSKNVGEVMLTDAKCASQLNMKQTAHQQEPPALMHTVIRDVRSTS